MLCCRCRHSSFFVAVAAPAWTIKEVPFKGYDYREPAGYRFRVRCIKLVWVPIFTLVLCPFILNAPAMLHNS